MRHAGRVTGRSDLGDFLRARREALRPADVGLAGGGRRRTPGLRREEVAALAGVSIDYLIRIEQGRDTHPSPAVLAGLASALRLRDDERTHMVRLAALTNSRELCPVATPIGSEAAPGVRHLLDALVSTPAFVVGPIGNVVAWNGAWERLVAPLGFVDHVPPNLARYVFTDPRARKVFVDWPGAADEQVARLRAAEPRWGADPDYAALLAELEAVEEFGPRWSAHPVAEKHRGTKRLRMSDAGDLSVAYEVLLLADDDQQLVTWRGADDESAARMSETLGEGRRVSPAQLSIVVNR